MKCVEEQFPKFGKFCLLNVTDPKEKVENGVIERLQ